MLQEINFFIQKATQQTYLIYYIYQLHGYTLPSKFKLTIIMIKLSSWKCILEKTSFSYVDIFMAKLPQCAVSRWNVSSSSAILILLLCTLVAVHKSNFLGWKKPLHQKRELHHAAALCKLIYDVFVRLFRTIVVSCKKVTLILETWLLLVKPIALMELNTMPNNFWLLHCFKCVFS